MKFCIRAFVSLNVFFFLLSCGKSSKEEFNMPGSKLASKDQSDKVRLSYLSDAILGNPSDATNYYKRSELYFQMGMYEEANIDIDRAERFDANNGLYSYQKAKIGQALGDKNALSNAIRSEELGHQSVELFALLAELSIKARKTDEAKKYIQQAESFFPYSSDVQIARGNLSLSLKDTSMALVYFKKSLNLAPHKIKPYEVLIDNYLKQSMLDSSLRILNQGVKRFPNNERFTLQKAYIFERAGRSDTAIAIYRRILKVNPERYDISEKIGNLFLRNKNYSSAFLIFDGIFKQNTDSSRFLYKAADTFEARDQFTNGIKYLQENGDDFEEDKDYLTRINRMQTKLDNNFVSTPPKVEEIEVELEKHKKIVKPAKKEPVKEVIEEPRLKNSQIQTIERRKLNL
ncbi:MAG: tetratricopeptide repeat protein [Leadbetterella sp.]